MNDTGLINTYIDELSHNDDFSVIYIDSSNNQTIIKTYNNLRYFEPYSNLIHYSVPSGYTDDKDKAIGDYPIGITDVKASEHHLKIYYDVAPIKKQSLITVNYLLNDTLVSTKINTGAVGDSFDINSVQNNVPSGYQFLEISSGLINQYTYKDQIINVELTQNPTSSSIEIIYKDENTGSILNLLSVNGKIGSSFSLSTYESQVPTGYQFDNTDTSITTFPSDSTAIVLNCKTKTGIIIINYSNNGNIVSSTSTTGSIGSTFNIGSYTSNIPSGYSYVSDNSSQVTTFQPEDQTVTINVTPASAPQPVSSDITEPVEAVYDHNGSDSVITRWNNVSEPPNTVLTDAQWAAQQGETEITDANGNWFTVSTNSSVPIQWGTGIDPNGTNIVFYEPVTNNNANSAASISASISASNSTEDSIHTNNAPFHPKPSHHVSGSTNATFEFIHLGETIIHPTIRISYGNHSMSQVLKMIRSKGFDTNAKANTLTAGYKTYKIVDTYVDVTPGGQQVYEVGLKRA